MNYSFVDRLRANCKPAQMPAWYVCVINYLTKTPLQSRQLEVNEWDQLWNYLVQNTVHSSSWVVAFFLEAGLSVTREIRRDNPPRLRQTTDQWVPAVLVARDTVNENNGRRRVGRTSLGTASPRISDQVVDTKSIDSHWFRGYPQYVSVMNAYEPASIEQLQESVNTVLIWRTS